jgi:hypothetical protein
MLPDLITAGSINAAARRHHRPVLRNGDHSARRRPDHPDLRPQPGASWVEHGATTGPQLVPVPRDVPEPLPPPTFVPPPPGYSYAPPPPPPPGFRLWFWPR